MVQQMYSMVPLMRAAEEKSLRGHPAAIGAYNVNFWAQAKGILRGLEMTEAPGIIQASRGANKFQGGPDKIQLMVLDAMSSTPYDHRVAFHLDHGTEEAAIDCINNGFSSVMIDASKLPEMDNIELTKKIVEAAHKKGVSVEGEYGLLSGVEEDVEHAKTVYADPVFVPVFLGRSGADALAIAYGTSHGPNKGHTDALDLSIVARSYKGLVAQGMNLDKFLVSHGSSAVPPEFVALINEYGGALKGASGVPAYMVTRAISLGMRKVNIDTDLRLAMTGKVREWLSKNGERAEQSELVGKIKAIFDGKIKAYDKDKNEVDPAQITDPRSWLKPIMDDTPEVLRKDYRNTNDEAFIEVMQIVEDTVAEHVANLNRVFGSAGLITEVDSNMTLEVMASKY